MKTRIKLKILAFFIIAFFSFLIFKAVQSSLVYYQTVSEVLMNDESINSFRQLRVMGTVKDNSIVFNSDGSIEFKIEDSGKEIFVQYKGIIPDIFKDGVEAVVEGDFDGSIFTAKKLFAKCPTKYEDEEYRKELT